MSEVARLEYAYGVCPKCKHGGYLRYLIRNDGLTHKPYEIKCINCNSYFAKEDIFGSGEETAPKPVTNADRIRSMTDEELAEFMIGVLCYTKLPYMEVREKALRDNELLDWLKEEADHD